MALALKARAAEAERLERARRLFDPAGEDTLEAVFQAVWVSLAARGEARCPVCGGTLERLGGSEAAECGDCGSSLD
jgi:hypothetical protein